MTDEWPDDDDVIRYTQRSPEGPDEDEVQPHLSDERVSAETAEAIRRIADTPVVADEIRLVYEPERPDEGLREVPYPPHGQHNVPAEVAAWRAGWIAGRDAVLPLLTAERERALLDAADAWDAQPPATENGPFARWLRLRAALSATDPGSTA